MADIIDLRKKKPIVAQSSGPVIDKEVTLEWSAREYEKKNRRTSWYVGIGVLAAALVIFGIIARSYFFIFFVALAYAVFMMYEKRTPAEFNFSVSAEGVRVGKTLHKFSELKSFWIFASKVPGKATELSIEADKSFSPYIRAPLKNIDPEKVRGFLLNYLPEEEHQEFITDQIERNL